MRLDNRNQFLTSAHYGSVDSNTVEEEPANANVNKKSSLDIKVSGGSKKTTPPKPKPSMRRRRATDSGGKEYYHRNEYENNMELSPEEGSSASSSSGRGSTSKSDRSSSKGTGKRTKKETNSGGNNSNSNHRYNKASSSIPKLGQNSIRLEDIPVGQWIVLICILLGLIGFAKQKGNVSLKNVDKPSSGRKKKSKKLNSRNHNKSKHKISAEKDTLSKSNKTEIKTEIIETTIKDEENKIESEFRPNEELTNSPTKTVEATNSRTTSTSEKKKKSTPRIKKKKAKQTSSNPSVTENDLKPSVPVINPNFKSSPDSVSTDGSSSTVHDKSQLDNLGIEEEFDAAFYIESEINPRYKEEEWTTVVKDRHEKVIQRKATISTRNESEPDITQDENNKVNTSADTNLQYKNKSVDNSSLTNVENVEIPVDKSEQKEQTPPHDIIEKVKKKDNQIVENNASEVVLNQEEKKESEELNQEEKKETEELNQEEKKETEELNQEEKENELVNQEEKKESEELNQEEKKESEESKEKERENEEVNQEEKKKSEVSEVVKNTLSTINVIISNTGNAEKSTNDPTLASSFSAEDDEAFARQLQKEEEELAAAVDFTCNNYDSSTANHSTDDLWEEVKRKRNGKKTSTVVEQQ